MKRFNGQIKLVNTVLCWYVKAFWYEGNRLWISISRTNHRCGSDVRMMTIFWGALTAIFPHALFASHCLNVHPDQKYWRSLTDFLDRLAVTLAVWLTRYLLLPRVRFSACITGCLPLGAPNPFKVALNKVDLVERGAHMVGEGGDIGASWVLHLRRCSVMN
jgi:hypothetical protein